MNTQHTPSTAKHVFLHLLLVGMLFMNLIGMIQLAFLYIDRLFATRTVDNYIFSDYSVVRWSSSILIVCVPVFLLVSKYIYKDIRRDESLQHIWVRRWLLSFTLFAAAITIIGSLISVVYNFYNGELTASFTSKLAVLILLSIAIGAYYRWDMKRDMKKSSPLVHVAWISVSVVTLAMLIIGLVMVGTPAQYRKMQNDQTRVNDLQNIQSYVEQYYYQKSTIPTSLQELTSGSFVFTIPTDPKSGDEYEYIATSSTTFQLCATFETDGTTTTPPGLARPYDAGAYGYMPYTDEWKHSASRTCFDRTIDTQTVVPMAK